MNYIPTTTIRYTQPPGMNEISDIILALKFLIPKEVKVFTVDDIRLKSN